MSAAQRGAELERFRSAPDVHVMLFSLMAGSTGLNLTVRGHHGFHHWQRWPNSRQQGCQRPCTTAAAPHACTSICRA